MNAPAMQNPATRRRGGGQEYIMSRYIKPCTTLGLNLNFMWITLNQRVQ